MKIGDKIKFFLFGVVETGTVYDIDKKEKDKIYSNGGRVLNFISLSDDFLKARNEVHQSIKKLNWNGGFYRKDIGFRVID